MGPWSNCEKSNTRMWLRGPRFDSMVWEDMRPLSIDHLGVVSAQHERHMRGASFA